MPITDYMRDFFVTGTNFSAGGDIRACSHAGYLRASPVGRQSLADVAITIASPAKVTLAGATCESGTAVKFTTTGALPTGLVASTTYYLVTTATPDEYNLCATRADAIGSGVKITTSGSQSGVHTASIAAANLLNLALKVDAWLVACRLGFAANGASGSTPDLRAPAVGLTAMIRLGLSKYDPAINFGLFNDDVGIVGDKGIWQTFGFAAPASAIGTNTDNSAQAPMTTCGLIDRPQIDGNYVMVNLLVRVVAVAGTAVTLAYYVQAPWIIGCEPGSDAWFQARTAVCNMTDADSKFVFGFDTDTAQSLYYIYEARYCLDPDGELIGLTSAKNAPRIQTVRTAETNYTNFMDCPVAYINMAGTRRVLALAFAYTPLTARYQNYRLYKQEGTASEAWTEICPDGAGVAFFNDADTYTYLNASMHASGQTVLAIAQRTDYLDSAPSETTALVGRVSTDGGDTWGASFNIWAPGVSDDTVSLGPKAICRRANGTWLIAARSRGSRALKVFANANPGTAGDWSQIVTSGPVGGCEEPCIGEGPDGTLWALIRLNGTTDIKWQGLSKSVDNGATWTKPWSGGAGYDLLDGSGTRPAIPCQYNPACLLFVDGLAYIFAPYSREYTESVPSRISQCCWRASNIADSATYRRYRSPVVGFRERGLVGYPSAIRIGADLVLGLGCYYEGARVLTIPDFFPAAATSAGVLVV